MGAELANISGHPVLSQFLFNFRYKNFIGKNLVPIAPVGQGNRIFKVQTLNENPYRIPSGSGKTGPRGKVEMVEIDASQDEFSVEDCYLQEPIDLIENETMATLGIDRRLVASRYIARLLELIYEKDVAALLTTQANYLAGFFSTPGTLWSTPATATPLTDILTAAEKLDEWPTKIGFGQQAWSKFILCDQVRSVFGITGGNMAVPSAITPQIVANYFQVDEVLIGKSKYNAAKLGQANDIQYLWGKHCVLLHQMQEPTKDDVTHSFAASELQADSMEFMDKDPGPRGSVWIRQGWNYKLILKAQRYGYLLESVVA